MTRDSASDATATGLREGLRCRTLSEATYRSVEALAEQYRRDSLALQGFGDKNLGLRLIYHAHRLIVRDPPKAEIVAFVAQHLAANLPSPTIAEAARVSLLEGKAWYEYASALLRLGRYEEAREAVLRSRAFFSLPIVAPKIRDEDARLNLVYAQVLHFLGKSEAGLALIDRAAEELLYVCEDAKQYVRARTIHATLLMRLDRFEEALELLDRVAESAAEEDDGETLAHVTHNIGLCAARLGDDKRAEECQKIALTLFQEHGMIAELPRVRGALITILRRRGRTAEAISELYMVRNDYLQLSMPLIAARYSMDIAELLVRTGRLSEAEHLCKTLLTTFRRAKLIGEARKALQFLRACANTSSVTEGTIAHVRSFFLALSSDDSVRFAPRAS
jgi:tetratricopeptide (TPR) repeat protein